jgi:crotonobetaine/carnitine-CoA ligase
MVAASIVGAIFVPIDPRTKGDKLKFMLNFAECKGAYIADYAIANVAEVWSDKQHWVVPLSSGEDNVARVLEDKTPYKTLPILSTDPNELMQMLFTSGTTGDPKAIMAPHARFSVGVSVASIIGLNQDDRPYTGLSLTHANAQLITLGCILGLGLRGVISRKFTKSRLWDITRHYGCTWFNLLGGMTTSIYAEPRKENDADNPVRIVLSAGMPAAIWSEFAERFDVKLTEFYGAAEGGLCFNVEGAGPVGSCGKPPESLEMKIFSEDDVECASGEAGEICFRNADGTTPVVNYFKKPEASAQKTRGGWLRMGDIGHKDENGWLYFHYRKGGGIRRNGDFINPAYVEKVISELKCVDDVFVYGVPIKNGAPGEKDIVAAIVTIKDVSFDAQEVFSACREKLESNFVPGYLHIVDEIPKTASEKPQERFLLNAFDENSDYIVTEKKAELVR